MDKERPCDVEVQGDLSSMAVVLCGGYGNRLRPISGDNYPKPLTPLGNQTLIDYSVKSLFEAGIGKVVFVVAYQGGKIVQHFMPQKIGMSEIVFKNQDKPDGIIKGIQLAIDERGSEKYMILLDADSVRENFNLLEALQKHVSLEAHTTLVLTTKDSGNKEYRICVDEQGVVTQIPPIPGTMNDFHESRVFTGVTICSLPALMHVIQNHQGKDS